MKYSYDNETQMVGVHGDDVTPDEHSRINRLNVGLASMKSMSKYTREDPNTYVLENMPDGPIRKAVKTSFLDIPKEPSEEEPAPKSMDKLDSDDIAGRKWNNRPKMRVIKPKSFQDLMNMDPSDLVTLQDAYKAGLSDGDDADDNNKI